MSFDSWRLSRQFYGHSETRQLLLLSTKQLLLMSLKMGLETHQDSINCSSSLLVVTRISTIVRLCPVRTEVFAPIWSMVICAIAPRITSVQIVRSPWTRPVWVVSIVVNTMERVFWKAHISTSIILKRNVNVAMATMDLFVRMISAWLWTVDTMAPANAYRMDKRNACAPSNGKARPVKTMLMNAWAILVWTMELASIMTVVIHADVESSISVSIVNANIRVSSTHRVWTMVYAELKMNITTANARPTSQVRIKALQRGKYLAFDSNRFQLWTTHLRVDTMSKQRHLYAR